MYRAALRSSSASIARAAARPPVFASGARRMLTTAPAGKKTTWKGSLARWGAAVGAIYWYNTSPIFADEASKPILAPPAVPEESEFPSVDAVLQEKRKHEAEVAERLAREEVAAAAEKKSRAEGGEEGAETAGSANPAEALEEEAGQQGAFNPETGEINWDCPCLGGMAHGPCGEEFKSAFSCFVYSEQEPKGMDCIDKFQHMQDCFRQHPEVYAAELADEEEADAEAAADGAAPLAIEAKPAEPAETATEEKEAAEAVSEAVSPVAKKEKETPKAKAAPKAKKEKKTKKAKKEVAEVAEVAEVKKETAEVAEVKEVEKDMSAADEPVQALAESTPQGDDAIPKAAFDATTANK